MVNVEITTRNSEYTVVYDDAQVTIGEETKVTDAKGCCLFKNIKPGVYDIRVFKEGVGCSIYHDVKIKDSSDGVYGLHLGILENNVFITLSADKTKIKKNESVTIVAQLFKHDKVATGIKQVSFSINGTQKVISDFDTDKEIAVMTLKGSNQGKVKITAHVQYRAERYTASADSNVLVIQDGDEE